ncbi:hypothetical protein PV08_10930 [Exophiala spinifera]|uniref:SnoaL-like domain-containing protein n=1 Tax=Exophiala spinifera TaxID=91928 RepID=A0A0D2AY47_9EURO|nr:uncharacterized protein PV08_10930 [Exophiala spinifera]KIW11628.1 hypothetical protein PV08_10930 [Exophiala spinifera]
MSSVAITRERLAQVQETIRKVLVDFPKPILTEEDKQRFLSVYHPDIQWSDHAFLVTRIGHEAVLGLHKAWNHCNQPFRADEKAIIPTPFGAVLEQVWTGRCANDIVRPSGEVVVKATGKDYVCHVCMVMEIDQDGLVTKVDEYYNRRWDDGVAQKDYVVMRGASIQSG